MCLDKIHRNEKNFEVNSVIIYQIIRIDRKEDSITSKKYSSYEEAYMVIERIYGDLCCSDSDIDYGSHYEIIKTIES